MKTTVIIAPHPDYAELAMGGTIAKMIAAGWDVTIVDLTNGEPTPFGSEQVRAQETNKASRILGIEKRLCLEMPNRRLEATLENRRRLAEAIRLYKPEMLFGPVLPEVHPDHIAAGELVAAARFEAKYHKTDMAAEAHWTAKLYSYYSTHRPTCDNPNPALLVDVSDYWEKKIAAVRAYQSQLRAARELNKVSLIDKIEATCRYFGASVGVKYAEPFAVDKPICVKNVEFSAFLT